MAHYKIKSSSRLQSRTQTTAPEWLKVVSQIGRVVNDWSRRSDLVVYGGDDSAEGRAIAAYYADISEIEVNLKGAFGELTKPETLGDFTDKETQLEFPNITGVIYHEALHARHTGWAIEVIAESLDNTEAQAFMLLEESRIEAKGIIERPTLRHFLRSSALNLALEEVDSMTLAQLGSELWATAHLIGLSLARVDAGVLEAIDVVEIREAVESLVEAELLAELRKVWVEFQTLEVSQVEPAIRLAKRWVELLRQVDPEGEPTGQGSVFEPSEGEGEDESESESGKGESNAMKMLKQALSDSAFEAEMNSSQDLSDQQTKEKWDEEAKQRQAEAKNRDSKKHQAKKVFDKSHNETGSGSSSRVQTRRTPTGRERASAVSIAKSLEKAKYRERSVHIRKSQIPQGKLIARNLVQNKAMESMGKRGELPAWKQKVRKHTDDPTLRVGVLVDISGSMSPAMEAMGSTAWILSEAGRRIQAKTAMVYYGSGVFPTLRIGQRLDEVTIYSAPDGTEKFGEAWTALDGELGLTYGDGVRLLVIVSDGYYTPSEEQRCKQALAECKQNGVAVLWLVPKECNSYNPKRFTEQVGWGVVASELEVSQIASVVGRTATEALGKVGQLT